MKIVDVDLSLYLVLDSQLTPIDKWLDVLDEAVSGGVTIVQLRDKVNESKTFYQRAKAAKELLVKRGIPLIVNDRVDIAAAVGAAGVHLGQSDLPLPAARRVVGADALIGLSASTVEETLIANEQEGVDYLGIGPIFETPTKSDAGSPLGLSGLAKCIQLSRYPVVAIGGINNLNAEQVTKCGVAGIAVVSAICCAASPRDAASDLTSTINKCKNAS